MVKARVVVGEDTEPQSDPQLTSNVNRTEVTEIVTPKESVVPKGLPPLADLPEPSQEIFDAPLRTLETDAGYDEALHESPPRKNAKGQWAKRRGGARKSGTSRADTPDDTPTATPEDTALKLEATSTLAASMLFLAGEMIVGQCMEPNPEERAGITSAFRDYFQATGHIEIPPWLGLMGATSVYVGRRWSHPQFQEKRQKWFPTVIENE